MGLAFRLRGHDAGKDLLSLPADAAEALCGLVLEVEQLEKVSYLHAMTLFDEPLLLAAHRPPDIAGGSRDETGPEAF